MHKVLVYLEPHPVRNTYVEFRFAVPFLLPSLAAAAERGEIDFRVFSNVHCVDSIAKSFPQYAKWLLRPTEQQGKTIASYEGEWNHKSVSVRTDLINGVGNVTQVYLGLLEELYRGFRFDTILCWSDNGAIGRFVKGNDTVSACYVELGPTRPPFQETVYLDPCGTNGAAAILGADLGQLPECDIVPATTWPALLNRNDPKSIGILDALCTLGEHNKDVRLPKRYVYIPMQLADDINTLCHSPFETPLNFLQEVLPRFVDQGLSVVIKGHPAAPSRVYNLVHETRALQFAASFGDKVTILNRSAPATTSLFAIGQAAYVCTINSSVGFEALLCGKQVFTTGNAVYDVGRKLRRDVNDLEKLPETVVDPEHRDRLTSFLCRHYLHPKPAIIDGDAIVRGIRYLHERRHVDKSSLFDAKWMETFHYDPRFSTMTSGTTVPNATAAQPQKMPAAAGTPIQTHAENVQGFDAKWYGTYYQDVSALRMDPLKHYLWIGKRMGRPPNEAALKAQRALRANGE